MTAMMEIKKAIADRLGTAVIDLSAGRLTPPDKRLVVMVGWSADKGVACEMENKQLPSHIMNCPVEKTDEFPGWNLIERA